MKNKKTRKKDIFKRNLPLILMSLPAIIMLLCFTYFPKFGLVLAFKDFNYPDGIFGSPWNGLENFRYIFSSGEIWSAVRNTVGYHLADTFFIHVIAIVIALMLYAVNKKAAKRYQFVITMPYLVSVSAMSATVYIFLRYDGGIVNLIREWIGKEAVGWYVTPGIWPMVLVLVWVWFGAGIKSIYYYSIFMGIDKALFEAVDIDGGSWWHKVRHVMMPAIVPILCLFIITDMGQLLTSNLARFLNIPMDNSALYGVTEVLSTYEYHGLQMGNISTTIALSLFIGTIQVVAVHSCNAIVSKISPENSLY